LSVYQILTFKVTGVVPLLMHNGQLVDPLNRHSQSIAQITKKKKKTDADHREVSRREFFGSLYLDADGGPCIPSEMQEAAIVRGAMKEKRGPAAKAGILVEDNARLDYHGPRDPHELWKDEQFHLRVPARVGAQKVMRTRPHFSEWASTFVIKYIPTLLNAAEVRSFLVAAGEQIGIGDWRPRFGRFRVEA
jgi:hypothetical protein